ncbi:MAG TPA: response regulator [Abditibacteriaceae bacterium]|jgi:DNA-binding response OmpR family regulator
MSKKKILVVDDEPDIVEMLAMNLIKSGYEVVSGQNGVEALELVAEHKPDLVLLDVMMPEMSGLDALKRLKADLATQNIPVVMLTAKDSPADMAEGWDNGSDLYLIKPIVPSELMEFIKVILE